MTDRKSCGDYAGYAGTDIKHIVSPNGSRPVIDLLIRLAGKSGR